jgi:hypothetical protein
MTTQDQQAQTVDRHAESLEEQPETLQPLEQDFPATPATGAPVAEGASPGEALFEENDLTNLRLRWTDIQTEFVDDPRQCVQNADSLVSDVVDQLTAGFAAARSRLEEQWARGEEISTEDLRVALTRYREFFERLLQV